MDATERFLRACRRQPVDRPPVWLMRQAGRYQASYQAVRSEVSFMELCRTPELACQVTVAAVEEMGVDAAILFSDILVPLEPMGLDVHFKGGPQVSPPVRTMADVERLEVDGVADALGYVYEAVERIVEALNGRVPLLGFAGAPLTLASYAVEGSGSKNHHELKRMMYAEPETLEALLSKFADVVLAYVRRQVQAGAVAIQLFDTWGGILTLEQWRRFSQPFTARVFEGLADLGVPRIHYVKGGAHLMDGLAELPVEVQSVDWRTPLAEVKATLGEGFAYQGNVDPGVLRAPPEVMESALAACLDSYGPRPGHILNLGHGITPDVSEEAVQTFVRLAKRLGAERGASAA